MQPETQMEDVGTNTAIQTFFFLNQIYLKYII